MNESEIDRIAATFNVLRPDWPVTSLRTLLARPELAHRPRRDVIVALGWVAAESESKTPARVIEAGPWWQAAAVESRTITRYPPKRGEDCKRHPGEWPESCRLCASERMAPVHELHPREESDDVRDWRIALQAAKSYLCSHGVRPEHCHEKHDQPEETA